MKIAVCFKVITDYDLVPSESWKGTGFLCPKCGFTDARYVKKNFGFFDEGALETGLRAKDQDSNMYLEAISFGTEDRIFTEALYAAGYDKVTYLRGRSDFDPKNTAQQLALYIQKESFDVILTGEAVGPMDSGSVPYFIAAQLSCPIVNQVTEISVRDGKLLLIRETEEAVETYAPQTPVVAVLSNAKYPYLRFALYGSKEKAKHMAANILSAKSGTDCAKLTLPVVRDRNIRFVSKEELPDLLNQQLSGDRV